MRTTKISLIIACALFFLPGCNSDQPPAETEEAPRDAIAVLISLYEQRDFEALVRTRYAEIGKAETEEQVKSLIAKFAGRFKDDAALRGAISLLKEALLAKPQLSAEGNTATFQTTNGSLRLSRMPDGKWGFHL